MSYLSNSIPSPILYGSIFSEFLGIAQCIHRLTDFAPRPSQLSDRMITQGGNKVRILRQTKQVFQRYREICRNIVRHMTD